MYLHAHCILHESTQINVCQSHSQSRAKVVFVTTVEKDNFDYTKINAHFKNFTASLLEGLTHKWKHSPLLASITSPPYVGKQLTVLLHTQRRLSRYHDCVLQCSTNAK